MRRWRHPMATSRDLLVAAHFAPSEPVDVAQEAMEAGLSSTSPPFIDLINLFFIAYFFGAQNVSRGHFAPRSHFVREATCK